MQSLTELVKNNEYETDKDTTHSYIESYDSIFSEYKDKKINLLEIGNHHGGSLRLWKDYFSNATMIGIEVGERTGLRFFDDVENVTVYENTDAISFETIRLIEDLDMKFDIIIDDASHLPNHQVFTCKFWSNFLKDDGVLVIEDIQNIEYCDAIANSLPVDFSDVRTIDLRNEKGRFDDIMIVAKKSGGLN